MTPKSFNLLLRVKRRRQEQLEDEVRAAQQAVREREQALAEAEQQADTARSNQHGCEAKIDALATSNGFHGSDLITLQHVLEQLKGETQRAEQGVAQAQQQVQQAQALVVQARQAVQRVESQIEMIEQRRDKLLREMELAQEDVQDEESEEASVARLLARTREAAAVAQASP